MTVFGLMNGLMSGLVENRKRCWYAFCWFAVGAIASAAACGQAPTLVDDPSTNDPTPMAGKELEKTETVTQAATDVPTQEATTTVPANVPSAPSPDELKKAAAQVQREPSPEVSEPMITNGAEPSRGLMALPITPDSDPNDSKAAAVQSSISRPSNVPVPQQPPTAAMSRRPYLGIVAGSQSARVIRIRERSAASLAGFAVSDIILKVGESQVASFEEVLQLISKRRPGDSLDIVVQRDGQPVTLFVILGVNSK